MHYFNLYIKVQNNKIYRYLYNIYIFIFLDSQMSFWGTFECPIQLYNLIFITPYSTKRRVDRPKNFKGELNDDIISIIVGTLLGDSYAEKRGNT